MKIRADLRVGKLYVGDSHYSISCDVRSLANKRRDLDEVIQTVPDRLPYDPRPFPKGIWKIIRLDWQADKKFDYNLYGPVKIITDAWQDVTVWELDELGNYLKETNRTVQDSGYLLHWGKSSTTWGCIRFANPEEAKMIGRIIELIIKKGESVDLEVI